MIPFFVMRLHFSLAYCLLVTAEELNSRLLLGGFSQNIISLHSFVLLINCGYPEKAQYFVKGFANIVGICIKCVSILSINKAVTSPRIKSF